MLTPEEQATLANIESLIEQLKMSTAAQDTSAEEPVMMADHEEEKPKEPKPDMDNDEEDRMKAAKGEDGSTGSDSSEERIDDIPEVDEENQAAVKSLIAKGVLKLASKHEQAMKAQQDQREIVGAIGNLATVVKSIMTDTKENQTAISGILQDAGFNPKVEKSIVHKSLVNSPANPEIENDRNKILEEIHKGLKDGQFGVNGNSTKTQSVRKDLSGAMSSLFQS